MNFRVYEVQEPRFKIQASSSKDIFEYLGQYAKADREIFLALFFNAKNYLLEAVPIMIGTVDSSAVYPREIIKEAIRLGASSVILAHNHPTGDPAPSAEDMRMTKMLACCLQIMGIILLDHVIIGKGCYHSFADNGKIEEYKQAAEQNYKAMGL